MSSLAQLVSKLEYLEKPGLHFCKSLEEFLYLLPYLKLHALLAIGCDLLKDKNSIEIEYQPALHYDEVVKAQYAIVDGEDDHAIAFSSQICVSPHGSEKLKVTACLDMVFPSKNRYSIKFDVGGYKDLVISKSLRIRGATIRINDVDKLKDYKHLVEIRLHASSPVDKETYKRLLMKLSNPKLAFLKVVTIGTATMKHCGIKSWSELAEGFRDYEGLEISVRDSDKKHDSQ